MAGQLKLRRGTTSQLANYIGSEGELIYDTEKKQLQVHDGITVGGKVVDDPTRDVTSQVSNATETTAGKAKIATTTIAQAGVNDADIITAKKLRDAFNASGEAPIFPSRAWGCVNTKNGTIYGHGNIQSFSVTSTGVATVVFKTPMPHSNYAVLLGDAQNPAALARAVVKAVNSEGLPDNKTTSGFILATGTSAGYYGMDNVYFSVVC